MKFVVLNGPPRSGKDTGAAIILKHYTDAMIYKMSSPLKSSIPAFFGISHERWRVLQEKHKDIAAPELFMNTPRDVQISLSEDWAKEKFGIHIFGHLACRFLEKSMANFVIIDDAGFDYELVPLMAKYGRSNFLIIRLSREGTSYDHDSRSYLDIADVTTVDYANNHMQEIYEAFMLQEIGKKWPDRSMTQ